MSDAERTLIESTTTRRTRLLAALVFGPLDSRRSVNQNTRRFVASMVLAAVVAVACVGTSLVLHIMATNKANQAIATLQAALAASPVIPPDTTRDQATGLLTDKNGNLFDPRTGYPVDPVTGLATDPQGRFIDPRSGWYADPATGYLTDPKTGITIDPVTLTVVTVADSTNPAGTNPAGTNPSSTNKATP
jgi:hypothetical protein